MKKFFKVLGIIFGVLIVIYLAFDITFSIQLHNKIAELKRQGKPTTIAEIIPPPVPDEENAAILYNRAFELVTSENEDAAINKTKKIIHELKSLSDISEWTNEQKREISKLINSYELQKIYSLLEEGSQKPKCRFDLEYEKGGANITMPHLNSMRDAVRFLCLRALVEVEEGNLEEAFNVLLVGLKISNHLKDEPTLVSQLVRVACDNIIIECIESIAGSKGIPIEKVKLIINELSYHTYIEPFIKAMDGERVHFGIWTFERVLRGEFSVWRSCGCWDVPLDVAIYESSLNKPALKRDFIWYLTLFSNMQEKHNLLYYEIAASIQEEKIEKQIPRYCFFTKILLPAYNRARETMAKHKANIEVCKTGLVLKIYKTENGAYPETLSSLSEVPVDPFSGKELIYKKSGDGFILYSLGPDMKDDGGVSREEVEDRENYDIVWKCEK